MASASEAVNTSNRRSLGRGYVVELQSAWRLVQQTVGEELVGQGHHCLLVEAVAEVAPLELSLRRKGTEQRAESKKQRAASNKKSVKGLQ